MAATVWRPGEQLFTLDWLWTVAYFSSPWGGDTRDRRTEEALRSYQLDLLPDVSISRVTAQQLLLQGGNTLHSCGMFPHM